MKQMVIGIVLAIFISLSSHYAEGQVDMGVIGAVGIPRGCMDFSINGLWFVRMNLPFPVNPELMFHESFSTKNDENGGGRLSVNVLTSYLLGRYAIVSPFPKLSPYIASGIGIHLINSFSANESAIGGKSKTILVSKAHLFLGLDLSLSSKWFLSAQGRVTYPSDIILDSGYLGLGVKF